MLHQLRRTTIAIREAQAFLAKPYSADEVLHVVHAVMYDEAGSDLGSL